MVKMTYEQVKAFIDRVEKLIINENLSKAEFYKKAGYTDAAYSQWVTGQTTPSARSIAKTANALNVSATYLITGEEKEKAPAHLGKDSFDEILDSMSNAELIEFIKKASERLKGN